MYVAKAGRKGGGRIGDVELAVADFDAQRKHAHSRGVAGRMPHGKSVELPRCQK